MEERPAAPQWEPLAKRSPKLPKALPQLEPMPPEVASLGAPARSQVTMKPVTISQQEVQRPGAPVRRELRAEQPPKLPEPSPLASPPAAQSSQASPPEHAQLAAVRDAAALSAPQLPCAA